MPTELRISCGSQAESHGRVGAEMEGIVGARGDRVWLQEGSLGEEVVELPE